MYTPFAFGLGRLASAPLSKVSPLIIIKEKKYPAQTSPASAEGRLRPPARFILVPAILPGLGSGAAAAASEFCPGTRLASPASVAGRLRPPAKFVLVPG